jgi:hypothetical protein
LKLTKTRLKQIIKEVLSETDDYDLNISPGNVQVPDDVVASHKKGYLQNVIDKYVDMVADTPDEMRQTLENIAAALKNKEALQTGLISTGLSEFARNLLPDAVEKIASWAGDEPSENRDKIAMSGMQGSEVSNSNFEQVAATWNTSIASDGNPSWKKRHKSESNRFRQAFVTLDLAAGKWEWVVFESKVTRDEDIIEDDIEQGATASLRDAILAAEQVLTEY